MNKIGYISWNGLGDKFVDLAGLSVICNYLKRPAFVDFNRTLYESSISAKRGSSFYDERLFVFPEVTFVKELPDCELLGGIAAGSTFTPPNIYTFFQQKGINLSYKQVADMFLEQIDKIKPTLIISNLIPERLKNAYGIHLRRSDKINKNPGNYSFENSQIDFDTIVRKLKDDLTNVISKEENPSFFCCSEEQEWKEEFCDFIRNTATYLGKSVEIIEVNHDPALDKEYRGFGPVLDLFCLSKCKLIYQGVKYSSFSLAAAMMGERKIINYAKLVSAYNRCLIHFWSSCLIINQEEKKYDLHTRLRLLINSSRIVNL